MNAPASVALEPSRQEFLDRLGATASFDVIVIGGGATGLGIAVDAAARGFSTALFEAEDFAKGTSSRATKLVHGGCGISRRETCRSSASRCGSGSC